MKDIEAGKCVYEVQIFDQDNHKVTMGFFLDIELANTYKASLMRRFPLTGINVRSHQLMKNDSDIKRVDKEFT